MIAVIIHRLGPYHLARLQAAGNVLPILAVELAAETGEYAWDKVGGESSFTRMTLFPEGDSNQATPAELSTRLASCLGAYPVEVVAVPGWSDKGALTALLWCSCHNVPAVVMSDSTAWDECRKWWKEDIKRRVVGLCSAALVAGHPHADYLSLLGMPRKRISLGYDVVDNEYFAAEASKHRYLDVSEEGISAVRTGPYFLASNRFIEKKNLFGLLDAYDAYHSKFKIQNSKSEIWPLVMLGDGELKQQLLAHCAKLGLHVIESAPWEVEEKAESRKLKAESEDRESPPTSGLRPPVSGTVHFPGFRQIDELPRFYAHAGAFVHASTTEQWGLVINEAMACGLPVIVSNRVGCTQDLVKDGVNGYCFDPYRADQLAQLMLRVSNEKFPLAEFGAASCAMIAAWDPPRFASGLKEASAMALEVGPIRARWWDRFLLKSLIWR